METKRKSAKVMVSLLVLAGLAVFSLFAVGGSLEPSAPPGPTMKTLDEVEPRIPITQDDIPLTITESGSYYFTSDVNSAGTAITVEVNDVTIDLMGYSLVGSGSGTGYGIHSAGPSNVEIRNGTIRDFGRNGIIEAGAGVDHRVINVRVIFNGRSGSYPGIYLTGKNHLLKGCTAQGNGSTGISTTLGCTVTGNTAYNNAGPGIYAYSGSTVTGNTAYDNDGPGIYTGSGCTVTGNTAYRNTGFGIYTSSGSTVTGNTVYENGSHGIDAGTGCTIIGNTARLNTGNGIDFDGLGTVADNTADRNGGHGISVNSGAVVARNSCSENTLDGIYASSGNRIVGNDCGGNGFGDDGAGIHVTSLRNAIESNTVLLNDRGIDVDSTRNFIAKNTATMNTTDYDIAGNNAYGPIVNIASVGDISGTTGADHPWANFQF